MKGYIEYAGNFPDDAHDVLRDYFRMGIEHVEEIAPGGLLEVIFDKGQSPNAMYRLLDDMVDDLERVGMRVDDSYVKGHQSYGGGIGQYLD